MNTAPIWLFVGFRFYSCLLEALQKADVTSSSPLPTCSIDAAAADNVTTALKSDRTDISAVAEQDFTSPFVVTPVACDQTMDAIDTVCDLFE